MKKIKVGVIGTGHLGSIHVKIWKQNPNIEFIGIYEENAARAEEIANQYETKGFSSLQEFISECDAATIAVPTSLHFEIAKQCIAGGIHCFIEKPITSTYQEAIELIELAEKHNVLIQVGHVERFNPALASLKDYNISPLFIEAHRLSQFKPRAIDVSVIHDLMIHDIDIVLWLAKSKIKSIEANGVGVLTDTPDIANARLTFESGMVANLTASRITARPMRKMRIFQKNAYFSIDFGKQEVEVYKIYDESPQSTGIVPAVMLGTIEAGTKNKNIYFEKPQVASINAIEEEQLAFIKSISENAPISVTGMEAAEALRIAEVINEAVLNNLQNSL